MGGVAAAVQSWLDGMEPAIAVDMHAIDTFCEDMLARTRARNTELNYASHFKLFRAWCEATGRNPLPADRETLKRFIGYELNIRKLRVSTVETHLFGIRAAHQRARVRMPSTDEAHQILKNTRVVRQEARRGRGKEPFTIQQVREISAKLARRGDPIALRNRAILVFGFASAFRRSYLAALDLEDIRFVDTGIWVRERYGKTDQTGEGRTLDLPFGRPNRPNTCPARTLQAWLKVRGKRAGPLFTHVSRSGKVSIERLSDDTIALVVKAGAELIGLDPRRYAGHTLRKTMATVARKSGAQDSAIMERGGWKKLQTVTDHYLNGQAPVSRVNPLAKVL